MSYLPSEAKSPPSSASASLLISTSCLDGLGGRIGLRSDESSPSSETTLTSEMQRLWPPRSRKQTLRRPFFRREP